MKTRLAEVAPWLQKIAGRSTSPKLTKRAVALKAQYPLATTPMAGTPSLPLAKTPSAVAVAPPAPKSASPAAPWRPVLTPAQKVDSLLTAFRAEHDPDKRAVLAAQLREARAVALVTSHESEAALLANFRAERDSDVRARIATHLRARRK